MSSRLVIDVGNTNIAFGIFSDGELENPDCISTVEVSTSSEIDEALNSYLQKFQSSFDEVVICCGVARIQKILESCEALRDKKAIYLGGINTGGVKIRYETPETLGPDRIANTIAASVLYGAPALVVDCGTAINIDFVNADGEFEGGLISPGLVTSRDALASYAPALPEVEINNVNNLIGHNTVECIQSGIVNGALALIDKVVGEVKQNNNDIKLIVTGGHGKIIHSQLGSEAILDEWLTLKGLGLARV